MGKITVWALFTVALLAQDIHLKNSCLNCHQKEQIPSSMIYKRYLMKYSSPSRIEDAMFAYLQHPQKENSIMPPQFFLKFPMKTALHVENTMLRQEIKAYIKTFDIKKKLRVIR